MTDKKKGLYYVDNGKLLLALRDYQDACRIADKANLPRPELPVYVTTSIILMAQKLGTRSSFCNYSYNDEMQQDAIENVIQYGIHSYDPTKPFTPFAYFSRIMWSAFIRRIEREQKQHYIKLVKGMGHQLEEQLLDNAYLPSPMEDNQNDFIRRFQDKNAKKKTKRARSNVKVKVVVKKTVTKRKKGG